MSTLAEAFARARDENRAALIGYLPAGFPTKEQGIELMAAMVAAGVDIVEVGLPYSDPLMDGPDIQAAVTTALAAGTTTDVVLDTVAAVADTGAVALVMSYWNPIEQYGVDRFAERMAAAGGRGVITPDLTPEEAGDWVAATTANGLDRVFLAAPSSTDARIGVIASVTSGFLYAASKMGVTGGRTAISSAAPDLVKRCRSLTDLPIAVGIGISTGEQAAEVAGYADGVIVGAAFVRRVLNAPDHAGALAGVTELATELAAGVRNPRIP
ncbi:MAG: tryptophan synthase subunit alpha [Actinomycetales bacterium]|nr:tryptophan synthase subunit alpha [Actinomycetales bacterium]